MTPMLVLYLPWLTSPLWGPPCWVITWRALRDERQARR